MPAASAASSSGPLARHEVDRQAGADDAAHPVGAEVTPDGGRAGQALTA
jgi:hypothetical protein